MVGEYDSNNLKNQFTFKVTFNSKYMVRKETRGRKGHNRIDLLRAELFAYMKLGHPTLRELEYQCRRNLDFMFLTKELCPSSGTTSRKSTSQTEIYLLI